MSFLIAKHLNGTKVYQDNKEIIVEVPEVILYKDKINFLENGTNLAISTCELFNSYVGVANSIWEARKKLNDTLTRVLSQFVVENVFLKYLEDLHFDITPLIPTFNTGSNHTLIILKRVNVGH
jgi:hypothetical protein